MQLVDFLARERLFVSLPVLGEQDLLQVLLLIVEERAEVLLVLADQVVDGSIAVLLGPVPHLHEVPGHDPVVLL